eukprot:COSAG02_NODE_49_length_45106_cov_298.436177_12_plen_137_part_00
MPWTPMWTQNACTLTLLSFVSRRADPHPPLHFDFPKRHAFYATKTSSSTQKKGERRIEVVQGPHRSDRHKHGMVVVIKDLTDPNGPTEKTMYIDRFVSAKLDRPTSDRHQRRNEPTIVLPMRSKPRTTTTWQRGTS